jgi:parallel beta-helix repeat protein
MFLKKYQLAGIVGCFILPGVLLLGDTFIVVNAHDSGDGSLRQAIIHANEHPGPDEIVFHIPKADPGYRSSDGVWTIRPLTDLPSITDHGLMIDGATQTAFIGTRSNPDGPEIELDGSLTPNSFGLNIKGNGTLIYDMIINRFSNGAGIFMEGVNGGRISGCYIGTDAKGMARASNNNGIVIGNHSNFVDVMPREDKFNIISGNPVAGISISNFCSHNKIEGNRIGVNRTGQDTLGNGTGHGYGGIYISDQSDSNLIVGNWIGGNRYGGVYVSIASSNTIIGNFIGTNAERTVNFGNVTYGVWIRSYSYSTENSKGNVIIGNHIGNNGFCGVMIEYERSFGNLITENSISQNAESGIYLNDGANGNVAAPTILTADGSEITGQAGANQTIEIFCDDDDEGRVYIAKTTSDASGYFHWTASSAPPLAFISATATDMNNNTSVFSSTLQWTGIRENHKDVLPGNYCLEQNVPNPFNLSTKIDYFLCDAAFVTLKVYNLQGREMGTLIQEYQSSGRHSAVYDAKDGESGIYYYQIEWSGSRQVRKMLMIK